MGFPKKVIGWIMGCVTTVSYSILINDVPSKPLKAKKEIRQGDLMSPFLFALTMEYLNRLIHCKKGKIFVFILNVKNQV